MGILLQLLSTSAIPTIDIPSLIMIFFEVSNLCWLFRSYALPIPPMFCSMILILSFLFPSLSW